MDFPLQNGKHIEVANWFPTTPTPIFNMGSIRQYNSSENVVYDDRADPVNTKYFSATIRLD
jgi:hypothetical protein